jgi:hypothetical protein
MEFSPDLRGGIPRPSAKRIPPNSSVTAVQLTQSTGNIAGTARDSGIGLFALGKWMKAD